MSERDVPWLDADQQLSWRAYITGTTLLMDRLDEDLRRDFKVSLAEYEILVRLSEADGKRMRMAQLADALRHSRSRVTHTVARMEKAGYLVRTSAAEDGRGIVASMTGKGEELLALAAPTHVHGVRDNLVDLVSREDFQALGRVMNAVSDRLVGEHPSADIRDAAR